MVYLTSARSGEGVNRNQGGDRGFRWRNTQLTGIRMADETDPREREGERESGREKNKEEERVDVWCSTGWLWR